MSEQIIVAAFVIVGTLFACVGLGLSWLLSPTNPTEGKKVTFESGVEPIGQPWVRFRAGYYVYAILYVIFDIETIFLYPWALSFGAKGTGWFIFIEMILFVAILLGGLIYAWKEGALEWH